MKHRRVLTSSWSPSIFLLLSLAAGQAQADTITVGPSGSGADLPSIQAAINIATDGDVIQVLPSTYNEKLDFKGKAVIVRGVNGAAETIISAAGAAGPVVLFNSGESNESVLEGVTLTGAVTTTNTQGGVSVVGSSPLLQDVVINGNIGYNGGGIYVSGGAPRFTRVDVTNNTANVQGGGVYVAAGSPELSGCRIFGNRSIGTAEIPSRGGGVLVFSGSPYLHNSLVASNTATRGGGVYIMANAGGSSSQRITIHNNLMTGNAATDVGGNLYLEGNAYISIQNNVFQLASDGGGVYSLQAPGAFTIYTYNDAYSNTDGNYPTGSLITGSGVGNVSLDPQFVAFSNDGDYSNEDLHLASSSPLIDAGSPELFDPDGTISDIGFYGGPDDPVDTDLDGMSDAYEYTYGLDPSSDDGAGDLDGDGITNLEEFELGSDPTSLDSDGDGVDDYTELLDDTDPTDPTDNQPLAEAGPDQYVDAGVTVTLDGSASIDPNGDAISYRWYFQDIPDTSLVTGLTDDTSIYPSFTPDVEGTYVIALVVNDGVVDSVPDTVIVHVAQQLNVPGDFATIQAAIDGAYDGDVIVVAAGSYRERIDLKGKAITLSGAGPGQSIIDGNNEGSVAVFQNGEGADSVLEGFTLKNGKVSTSSPNTNGGCVYINESLPTLRNLLLSNCTSGLNGGGLYARWTTGTLAISNIRIDRSNAQLFGGGLYLNGDVSELTHVDVSSCSSTGDGGGIHLATGKHTLTDVELSDNETAGSGGGLALISGTLTLTGSLIQGNVASNINIGGGGLYLIGTPVLRHNVIAENSAESGYGGGIYVRSDTTLEHSIVLHNSALSNGGNVYVASGVNLTGRHNVVAYAVARGGLYVLGTLDWVYNDVYGNSDGNYVGTGDQTDTNGNLSVDPGWVIFSNDGNLANDHFNLSAESPLRDAGDPFQLDPDGTAIDMGLYGSSGSADLDFDDDAVTFGAGDCDDWATSVPSETEIYDGLDQDCDGLIDDGASPDLDNDGYTIAAGDCDDSSALTYPGANEIKDGKDNNCNGVVDDNVVPGDDDGDGYSENGGDCDDADPTIFPNAPELDDDKDNDCNGQIDDIPIPDDDRDGYGVDVDCNDQDPAVNPGEIEISDGKDNDCDGLIDEAEAGSDLDGDDYTPAQGDCDDTDAARNPGAIEILDGIDNDCDDLVDEGTSDLDGDGFSESQGDCDDANAEVYPDNREVADGFDNDCNGLVDDRTVAYDDDGDGYSEDGTVGGERDCNDANRAIYPGAPELEDGKDNDCDGTTDEGTDAYDDDGDGFSENEGDCNDRDDEINPAAVEAADSIDNDCDDDIDEGTVLFDDDDDGFSEVNGDCDDADDDVYPTAPEVADGKDNDCDSLVDEDQDPGDDDDTPEETPEATPDDGDDKFGGGSCSCDQGSDSSGAPSHAALFIFSLAGLALIRRSRG